MGIFPARKNEEGGPSGYSGLQVPGPTNLGVGSVPSQTERYSKQMETKHTVLGSNVHALLKEKHRTMCLYFTARNGL